MSIVRKIYVMLCILLCIFCAQVLAENSITTPEARNHVGQIATVCGRVESTHFANTSRGQPTFLNLDRAYPNQIFTIVIWGSDRGRFGRPENKYLDKQICVTGEIKLYRGVPEVIAEKPNQIQIKHD